MASAPSNQWGTWIWIQLFWAPSCALGAAIWDSCPSESPWDCVKNTNWLNQLTKSETPELILLSKFSKIRQCPVFRKPALKRDLSSDRHGVWIPRLPPASSVALAPHLKNGNIDTVLWGGTTKPSSNLSFLKNEHHHGTSLTGLLGR